MKKRNKIIIGLLILIILIVAIYYGVVLLFLNGEKEIKVLDSIDKYGYNLEDRDTKLFEEYYNNLKNLLENDDVNYDSYAKNLAAIFIIDLYTINNKISKYDVGGSDYILIDNRDNFNLKVSDTMYKYISEEDINNLPEVNEINLGEVVETEYILGETTYEAYEIEVTWGYVKDLDYDTSGIVTMIISNDKLNVVELKGDAE